METSKPVDHNWQVFFSKFRFHCHFVFIAINSNILLLRNSRGYGNTDCCVANQVYSTGTPAKWTESAGVDARRGHAHVWRLQAALDVPEEALAALAGHGVKVEACGLVAAHATDPRHVPVKLILGQSGGAHDGGLHHWGGEKTGEMSLSSGEQCSVVQFAIGGQCRDSLPVYKSWQIKSSSLTSVEQIFQNPGISLK